MSLPSSFLLGRVGPAALAIVACIVWGVSVYGMEQPLSENALASIVSLSGGALLANIVSVVILAVETSYHRR